MALEATEARPRRWAFLVRPHPSVVGETEQRRARVAQTLLLVLLALGALDLTISAAGAYGADSSGLAVEAAATVGLGMAYAIARTRYVIIGIVFAIAVVDLIIWHFRQGAAPGPGEAAMMYFLAIPILVAGLVLPLKPASILGAATIAGAFVGETYLDDQSGSGLNTEDIGVFLLLLSVTILAVAASSLYDRDARRLHQSEQLLRQLADNLPEVFFVLAADGSRMLYTSPAYETVLGRRVAQAMADPQDWLKAVHPEDLVRVQAGLARNEPMLEYRAVMPSGVVKQIRVRTFPVAAADGKPVSRVGIAEDVTEARRAQEQLRDAQHQRIHLLQQLAHDLGSPLTPVKIQLHLLKSRVGADAQHSVAVVSRNVDHLERLVADVRDVARLEGGGLRIERREVDVVDLARQAVETLAPGAAERQVTVSIESPLALSVDADPGRLTQVLYNLVGNALKFTPPGGTVTVSIAREEGEVRIDVRDTGSGMRPDQLARLFKPFSQVHDPASVKRAADKGTGLGLFITKGIAEAHGGRATVRSAGPGLGSTFTVLLPLAAPK